MAQQMNGKGLISMGVAPSNLEGPGKQKEDASSQAFPSTVDASPLLP